jgi:hypothetical protein
VSRGSGDVSFSQFYEALTALAKPCSAWDRLCLALCDLRGFEKQLPIFRGNIHDDDPRMYSKCSKIGNKSNFLTFVRILEARG